MRERKLANIAKVDPELIVTANIGCMMQLQRGTSAPFVHTIEMLDWATGGPAPEAIGPLKDSGHPIEALVELAKQTARVDYGLEECLLPAEAEERCRFIDDADQCIMG